MDAPTADPGAGERRLDRRSVVAFLPVTVVMVAYATYYSRLSAEVHRGYGTAGFDLGIFDQGVWLLSRFHAPFVTVMGRNLFGDHTSFILLLLVPVYWVYPHTAALLVIQSGAIALGALPVYLLARRCLASNSMATVLAAAFLLHPALQWGNLEQFHPECFLVPLVGFAIYAAVAWKPRLLIVTMVLALLVKEDVALFIVPLGVWVAYRRDLRFGGRMVMAGVAAALISTEVVVRGLLGVPTLYANRIPFGGIAGSVQALLRKPGDVLDYLRADGRPFYVWQMILPSALVFACAPEVAALAVAVVAANVASTFPYQHSIHDHYSMSAVPIVAMGTVFAIGTRTSLEQRRAAVTAVAVLSLYTCFLWGALPAISIHTYPHWNPSRTEVHDVNAVLAALPPNASVSADFSFIPHLDHRVEVYQWPTPFKAGNWGTLHQEGQRLPFANKIEYLALRTNLSPEDQSTFDEIRSQFTVVKQVGYAVLLRRSSG